MKRDLLPIGTWVEVRGEVVVSQFADRRTVAQAELPPEGRYFAQVCGAKWLRQGRRSYGHDDGWTFESEGDSVLVYLVRRGMINLPVYAPVDMVEERSGQGHELPFMFVDRFRRQAYRDMLSDEAKSAPRDERGRFI